MEKKCVNCSVGVWRGMFCPSCYALHTAETVALANVDASEIRNVADVLSKHSLHDIEKNGKVLSRKLAIAIRSSLPRTHDWEQTAEIVKNKLANRLRSRADVWDKRERDAEVDEEIIKYL